ncbi:MAG: anthranilate synthase component I family protein [Flavobacterium sp.]
MLRCIRSITVEQPEKVKQQLLQWAQYAREVVFMDSNQYPHLYSEYDCLLALEAFTVLKTDYYAAFEALHQYQSLSKDWLFGYLSYDLKNDLEDLSSNNFDGLGFPDLYFFQPKKLFLLKGNELELHYLNLCDDEIDEDLTAVLNTELTSMAFQAESLSIQPRISRETYLERTTEMLAHIHRGDVYEANFCQEFFAENAEVNPFQVYGRLNEISEPPFATFLKLDAYYLMCASPERYLKKQGTKVISQPIKGTAPRHEDVELDKASKHALEQNPKERSENIMIVDLVRNDLSRTATKGSVTVEELCGMYSFKQVHQMISTITSEISHQTSPVALLQTTFPMGSMTGAPKISAMQIIEKLEETKRGLYSGAVGYFTPEGDFDFNVVIRSVLYNADRNYLSFSVGSAITAEAIPELEYEECLLKAKALFEVFNT